MFTSEGVGGLMRLIRNTSHAFNTEHKYIAFYYKVKDSLVFASSLKLQLMTGERFWQDL